MQTKLKVRMAVIAAILLLAVYGIIGLPRSAADLRQNLSENIRLGLDLKGGSHLVLQVQVQDAVKSEAEQTIERLKDSLRRAGIDYAAIDRNDPATVEEADTIAVNVKGIPVDKTREFRALVAENFPQWILTPVGAADYRMNMSPSELLTLKRDTVQRSIQSISTRIDELGKIPLPASGKQNDSFVVGGQQGWIEPGQALLGAVMGIGFSDTAE